MESRFVRALKIGLPWGLFVFLFIAVALPLLRGESIEPYDLLVHAAIGLVVSLLYGYTMTYMNEGSHKR